MATLSLVSRDGMQMTKRHMNRCSTSIPVREMQSRTTVTTSPWSDWPSLKSLQITNAGEGVEQREPLLHCWWECNLVQPLCKTVQRSLKKLKVELSYDPATPLLGTYPDKIIICKDPCTPMFIAAPLTKAKAWKQPKRPLTE